MPAHTDVWSSPALWSGSYSFGKRSVSLLPHRFLMCGSAMRLLGVRAIAISCLVTLGFLGCVEFGLAVVTKEEIDSRPTTWLLLSCAVVQVVCAICGICGFKNLNRECIKWFFVILFIR